MLIATPGRPLLVLNGSNMNVPDLGQPGLRDAVPGDPEALQAAADLPPYEDA